MQEDNSQDIVSELREVKDAVQSQVSTLTEINQQLREVFDLLNEALG
tara:strand:+ start:169 stop:309 length:141 start_codon:yes stop_codon:yes gene_type:complete